MLLRPLPPLLGRLVDGEIRRAIDVQGGLRLIYSVPRDPRGYATMLAERARRRAGAAEARVEDGQVVVDVPGVPEADRERFSDLLGGTSRLAFKMVLDGSSYMKALADRVQRDRASLTGISVDSDSWMHEATGNTHSDFFIYGPQRGDLERYVATLPPPEPGTELAFELMGRSPTPRWRTYYLASRVELDESYLADAQVIYDPTTNRPEVLITFDAEGRRRFAELSRKNIGRKLAILVDGTISSAPVIQSEITGGRSTITLGRGDPAQILREAEQLVARFRDGSALAGVHLVSQTFIVPRIASDTVMRLRAGAGVLAGLLTLVVAWAMGRRARA